MPVITSKTNTQQTAQTSGPGFIPRREIVANTQAQSISNPFSAPVKEAAKKDTEDNQSGHKSGQQSGQSGQLDTPEVEKSTEAVTLSPQLTALARRESKFRQQEQAFKADKAKVEQEMKELAELKSLKAKLEAKDYSALENLGVTYEEYQQYQLNQLEGQKPEAQAISKLQEEINQLKTQRTEDVDKQYEATVNQYRKDIKNLVAKDPAFESIKETAAEEHVLQHILDTFHEDGEILTVDQAAQEIEDAILEDALKMSNLTKVKAKQAPPVPEKKVLPPPQRSQVRTITQQMTPQTQSSGSFQRLSPHERLAAAIAKAQSRN